MASTHLVPAPATFPHLLPHPPRSLEMVPVSLLVPLLYTFMVLASVVAAVWEFRIARWWWSVGIGLQWNAVTSLPRHLNAI